MPVVPSFQNVRYGPNPLHLEQGGTMYYKFDVAFAGGTPPATFDYSVRMKDASGKVVKTMTGTQATNGQSTVAVQIHAAMTADGGGSLGQGSWTNEFQASSTDPDVQTATETLCMGRVSGLPPCPECDDESSGPMCARK